MTQQHDNDAAEIAPATAFQQLRGELVRLGRLVDHLGSAPDRMHNYTPTLTGMEQSLKSVRETLSRIENSPAVKLTHDAVHGKIMALSQIIRAEDRQMLIEAQTAMTQAVGRIDGIVERGQAADRDKRKERRRATALVASGMLILSIVLGPAARALPASWHVPEWIAEGVLALDTKAAAERFSQLAREREPLPSVIADPAPKPESSSPTMRRKSRH